ncbi:MAG: class I SAM-dependent methyltransferase [Gammaproteobacteria bacterium]|nr:MAG: class I SAM-dependent methyltransferase [Gammaproteobacteria bacterium]
MRLYRYFTDGVPWYLARHYWWAYLWSKAVWFFDHQTIINAILFFQYKKLMQVTLNRFQSSPKKRVLQLTCVYGSLTPTLCREMGNNPLHIIDVAPIQLQLAMKKARSGRLIPCRMNAEKLGYRDDAFDTVIVFFLLHEMPPEARINTLNECLRILAPGGSLIITEYAELPRQHLLYRIWPCRWLITQLEPFLDGFWHEDLDALLQGSAHRVGKKLRKTRQDKIFSAFYRVNSYSIEHLPIETTN